MEIRNKFKGPLCVTGSFLILFSLGTMYTFGNMSPYMSSYLKFKTNNSWITTGDTVWVLAGNFFALGGLMAIGGLIERKLGNRLTCLLGGYSMSLCVGLTGLTIKTNLWLVILTYGLGFGLGIAIAYSVALTSAMKWYPQKKGMISGIVVGGFGLGSFIFSFFQTRYINPLNIPPRFFNHSFDTTVNYSGFGNVTYNKTTKYKEKYFFDESILNKVPMCFVIMGIIYAIIHTIGVLLLMDHGASVNKSSEQPKENEKGDHEKNKDFLLKTIESELKKDFKPSEALKTKVFWLLWATFFFNGIVIVTISAVFKSFGQQFISDDQYFATLGAIGGICNCLGRVCWGRLFDKFSYRIVMTALTLLMTVTMGTFYFLSFIGHIVLVKIFYFIWGCLLFIGLSGSFAILPSGTALCFGSTFLATIYGIIFTGLALSSIVGAFVSSFLFSMMQYHGQFIMATIAAIISLILTQFFKVPATKKDPYKLQHDETKVDPSKLDIEGSEKKPMITEENC